VFKDMSEKSDDIAEFKKATKQQLKFLKKRLDKLEQQQKKDSEDFYEDSHRDSKELLKG
jgi:hypothetical protein